MQLGADARFPLGHPQSGGFCCVLGLQDVMRREDARGAGAWPHDEDRFG